MRNPRKTRTTPTIAIAGPICACRRRTAIATEAPGLAVVTDAAPPRLVAGDVGVLRLERLVARPRAARAGVARRRCRPTPAEPQDEVDRVPRVSSPPSVGASSRSRTARLHERGVRLAAGRLHDLADEEADGLGLARPVVGDGGRVGRQDLVDGRAERARIGDLAEAARRDDRRGRLPAGDVRLEDLAALARG